MSDHIPRGGSKRSPNDIADELRAAIADGVFPPGHRLVHEELADRFGVSRIPLREAIRTLVGEGLLQSPPGRGTFVTALDLAEIDEIYDLRKLVEPSFSEHVVQGGSRADVARLGKMVERMDQIEQLGSEGWSRLNFAFHLDMYRLAGLPMRYEVISRLYHQLEPYSRFYVHSTHALDRVQAEHKAMVAALAEGDAGALSRQIFAHIDGGQRGLRAAWHQRDPHRDPSNPAPSAHRAPPASEARTQRDPHRDPSNPAPSAHRAPPASEARIRRAEFPGRVLEPQR